MSVDSEEWFAHVRYEGLYNEATQLFIKVERKFFFGDVERFIDHFKI